MNNKGFTLLELLISVTVLTLISVILFGAMRLGTRSVESGEKRVEFLERSRASVRIIDSQIQSLLPVTIDNDGAKTYQFSGEADTLQFPSNSSVLGKQKGNVLVTYKVVPNENGTKSLHVYETFLATTSEETITPDSVISAAGKEEEVKLFDGFEDISFKYYFRDPTEESGKWIESWTEEEIVPDKIQLHLLRDKMDSTFIIPVRASATIAQTQVVSSGQPTGSTRPAGSGGQKK